MNKATAYIGAAIVLTGAVAVFIFLKRKNNMGVIQHSPLGYIPTDNDVRSAFGPRIHPITKKRTFHNGVDLRGADADDVYAVFDGVIVVDDDIDDSEGGKQVVLQGDNGWRAGYAHLNMNVVEVGERVSSGEIIGLVGHTGGVTGPHLHFTLTNPAGEKVDPMPKLKEISNA